MLTSQLTPPGPRPGLSVPGPSMPSVLPVSHWNEWFFSVRVRTYCSIICASLWKHALKILYISWNFPPAMFVEHLLGSLAGLGLRGGRRQFPSVHSSERHREGN